MPGTSSEGIGSRFEPRSAFVAGTQSGLLRGAWKPVAPMPRENLKWWPYKNESSDAERGADLRVAVMKIFQRNWTGGVALCSPR